VNRREREGGERERKEKVPLSNVKTKLTNYTVCDSICVRGYLYVLHVPTSFSHHLLYLNKTRTRREDNYKRNTLMLE